MIDIFLKLSLIDLLDLSLKFNRKKEFKKNIQVSFFLIIFLNLLFISFYALYNDYDYKFVFLLLLNIFFFLIVKYLFIILFYENKSEYFSFYSILLSFFVFFILYVFFYIQQLDQFNLIYAYILSYLLIIIINIKKISEYHMINFRIKKFQNELNQIFNLIKKNKNFILFNFLRSIYFPIFAYIIIKLNNNNDEIVAASGVSLAISLFASNIIQRTYFKYNLKNIKDNNHNFFNLYLILGLIFFLIILYLGILYVNFFYFENRNKYFNFIYINFIIIGFFNYLLELILHKIIYHNKLKLYLIFNLIKIFFLIFLFLIFEYQNLDYKNFVVINVILFSIISLYSLIVSKKQFSYK